MKERLPDEMDAIKATLAAHINARLQAADETERLRLIVKMLDQMPSSFLRIMDFGIAMNVVVLDGQEGL